MTLAAERQRARVRVRGQVQGVGFRPFVCVLARRHALSGWVANDEQGVLLEAEGEQLQAFLQDLAHEAPPLARVDAIEPESLALEGDQGPFLIRSSTHGGRASTDIAPDAAICRACLDELFDPQDRRHLYPFLNCTHCGPRHTITRAVPYDRSRTSMAGFVLCTDCRREQLDPEDRRFHAQPIACPACGPRLSMPPREITARLLRGEIVAIAGLGGYHLACDARDERAVHELRRRKERDDKPFAVMGLGSSSVARWAELSLAELALLESPRRPVVLCRARSDHGLAASVAPGLGTFGCLLPYTPLHYLLFHEAAGRPDGTAWLDAPHDVAFVMTSANPGGEPLVRDQAGAEAHLRGIADAIVSHDREILVRSDDSVARVIDGAPRLLRRARGWVPEAIRLPFEADGVLAVGAHLKSTVCLVREDRAHVSQHLGDLDSVGTFTFFRDTIAHLVRTLETQPRLVAHDLHPDLRSTHWAVESGLPTLAVQHHHAHVAAVLAEHGRTGRALGVALDGFGLGPHGGMWGGELLALEGASFERVGHLGELALPGLDRAAREPWRMAVSALGALDRRDDAIRRWGEPARKILAMVDRDVASPRTSSAGRWFDAAAALLGLCDRVSYEGEAAMLLEAQVRSPRVDHDAYRIDGNVLDLLPLLAALRGLSPVEGAELFHGTFAHALVAWIVPHVATRGLSAVALSGGCFANRFLAEGVSRGLRAAGVEPLLPARFPPNDGAISLGQAYIAAHASTRRVAAPGSVKPCA